jgi:adenylosuccinate synthase
VTRGKTSPEHALACCKEWGIENVQTMGIMRTYLTRHGAGPLPGYDKWLTDKVGPNGNDYNIWQGHMRAGHWNTNLWDRIPDLKKWSSVVAVNCCDHLWSEELKRSVEEYIGKIVLTADGPTWKDRFVRVKDLVEV